MTKKRFVILAVILVLSLFWIPAMAGPPQEASGEWYYLPAAPPQTTKIAGGNVFMTISDTGYFTGAIAGEEVDTGSVVIHRNGLWFYLGVVSFAEATVDGRTGGLEMEVIGRRPDAFSEWVGTWRITAATGDLVGLHGEGTWAGPGWNPAFPLEHGVVSYSGNIHFEP